MSQRTSIQTNERRAAGVVLTDHRNSLQDLNTQVRATLGAISAYLNGPDRISLAATLVEEAIDMVREMDAALDSVNRSELAGPSPVAVLQSLRVDAAQEQTTEHRSHFGAAAVDAIRIDAETLRGLIMAADGVAGSSQHGGNALLAIITAALPIANALCRHVEGLQDA